MKKRVFALLLAMLIVVSLAACQTTPGTVSAEDGYELALITDVGTIDDKSFNQGAWEGLVQYAEEFDKTYKYYKPAEASDNAYLDAIDLAVKGGAKIVVTPGFLFETPIFIAQDRYPDVNFILVDGVPHDESYGEYRTEKNTVGIYYAEEQAGFLAGYAAVMDGYTKLGFMGGMAVPAVVRFGYGFIQGADYAAVELELEPDSVVVNYHYTGDFVPSPETQTKSASWYNDGVEVIFGCGGGLGSSVMSAAKQTDKMVIGVDIDQSYESSTVITSATKGLSASVYACIEAYYDGAFPGGETLIFDAANDGVGLPMETSKFENFTEEDYDKIFKELADGKIDIVRDVNENEEAVGVFDIPTSVVKVVYID